MFLAPLVPIQAKKDNDIPSATIKVQVHDDLSFIAAQIFDAQSLPIQYTRVYEKPISIGWQFLLIAKKSTRYVTTPRVHEARAV